MYLQHFGLDQHPFRITPNTAFFFSGANRGATLEALQFALLQQEGIVKVTGEVGAGKTMLCRMLLAHLPDTVDTLFLANPSLGPEDLLRQIASELGIGDPGSNAGAVLLAIQQALIERFARGRRVIALADEAHAMPIASLEQIRLLSNLETANQKLLQIVLFGQPELDEMLAGRAMRQLKDRITQHFRLSPLGASEVARYLDYRLRAAGYRGPELFAAAAVRLLTRASTGLSRRINILADKALLAVFAEGTHQVRPKHVRAAVSDSEYPLPRNRPALALGLALTAAVVAGSWYVLERRDTLAAAYAPADPIPAAPIQSAPPTPVTEPPPGEAPSAVLAPASVSEAQAESADELPLALGVLARAHQADTPDWIRKQPPEHWFLQLHTINNPRPQDIEDRLAALRAQLEPELLRVYVREIGRGVRVGIIYGSFATQGEAIAAQQRLRATRGVADSYPRQVRGLQ